ncbi:glycoside hydrolase family 130 protein [Phycisphaerales bacterium AB-hyl4]|uniref:Glycoside hydrolase family 130 protein n=1 Tax=Natronomicrosphaera hydrolytica TaxID=3242702 RepID=A0ABV4U3A3_9BACT
MSYGSEISDRANVNLQQQVVFPWENRPADVDEVVWRYTGNPIITRDAVPRSNSIFNSAVVPFGGRYAGVFRVDDRRRAMRLHAGYSDDAIHWTLNPDPIAFNGSDDLPYPFEYGYDPRVVYFDDRYYVTWCNGLKGQPTIGVGWTQNFQTFTQLENAFLPFNRNGVLFPRKIQGHYAMLSRPSDGGHTPFGDIYYSESPDMTFWGRHRHVMSPVPLTWQGTKIGAGPIPIETDDGWLLIYHGVLTSCNGFVYSLGAALLDLDQPWKVIARAEPYLLSPQQSYECVGDVPNVVFPCAALHDKGTGRLAIYYGAADTVTALAFAHLGELVQFVKDNNVQNSTTA